MRRSLRLIAAGLFVLLALPPVAGAAPARHRARSARFRAGAAAVDFQAPAFGTIAGGDPADCRPPGGGVAYDGPRQWAFTEPYRDVNGNGHFDDGEPYADCNGNGRWEGNLLGGGASSPRFFTKVADPVGARATVVSNGRRTIAVEVVDQEGLFNVYQERIREKVARDGVKLDGIYISATHDESAPDSLGLSGVSQASSSINDYWVDYMVDRSAKAIEDAYRARRAATLRFAEGREPANLRQCWSSYPFTDDRLMPAFQAVDSKGRTIVTLASVSQHAETLGFNRNDEQRGWVSSDWIHFFRTSLERRYGGVAIEMAGSVGSVETPEIFPDPLGQVPQHQIDESHPAGCRTLFKATGSPMPTGYDEETTRLGETLAAGVARALDRHPQRSRTNTIWGERADVCVPVTNTLFRVGALLGIFGGRPVYQDGCTQEAPPGPTGFATGTSLKTQVAAFRIGDGEFISLPGEVFPFTYLRGFQGPADMPDPTPGLPPWPLPHMHADFRFFDGLGEDMIGYIFPEGNGVGVPGEDPNNPDANDTDRFGCNHSDDAEAASSKAADVLAPPLIGLLDRHGRAERVVVGRYAMPDGTLSRDPLGGPELKCNQDQDFKPAGPAVAVWSKGGRVVRPRRWLSLSGRRQSRPDRDTRGYVTASGRRVWLEVFPDVQAPARVRIPPPARR